MKRYLWPAAVVVALALGWGAHDAVTWARASLSGPRSWREALALKDAGGAALPLATLTAIRAQTNMEIWDMLALGYAESKGDPTAVSSTGALGWLQVDPAHARWRKMDPEKLKHPSTNARIGAAVWRACKAGGRSDLEALCVWNNGETAWRKILAGADPLPAATLRLWVRFERKQRAYREWIENGVPLR